MHDIWNPWHGCTRVSPGCDHCYMYFLDGKRGGDGSLVRRTTNFRYPLKKTRDGHPHLRSGEMVRVCMTSDFFLAEADPWRPEAWEIMRERRDLVFFLLTKRPERVASCLPPGWNGGWENVFLNVSCEDQEQADRRIPLLLDLPFQHKGVMCAPLLGSVDLGPYLADGQIRQVIAGGENYGGDRSCHWEWIIALRKACESRGVRFCFIETGTHFVKDGKHYRLRSKKLQSRMARQSGATWDPGRLSFALTDELGFPVPEGILHRPRFTEACSECGSQPICNGATTCFPNACHPGRPGP